MTYEQKLVISCTIYSGTSQLRPSIYLSIYVSNLSIYLSNLSIYLYIYLSIYPWNSQNVVLILKWFLRYIVLRYWCGTGMVSLEVVSLHTLNCWAAMKCDLMCGQFVVQNEQSTCSVFILYPKVERSCFCCNKCLPCMVSASAAMAKSIRTNNDYY